MGRRAFLLAIGFGVASASLTGCGQAKDVNPIEADSPARATRGTAAEDRLPFYELKMAPKDLARLEQRASSNDTYPATFIANGAVFEQVKVRHRGQWARSWPKKPLKVFFNHDQLFEGKRCLNLNSAWRDPAFIRETLAYHVYASCGVPSPKSRMVGLKMNGQFQGLYVEVEQPDKAFVRRVDLKGASLFKAISSSNRADERDLGAEAAYSGHYGKESQKSEGFSDLQSFCHDLAHSTNRLDFFTQRVDLQKYVNYLAVTVLVQHWDCFNRNHYLLYDGHGSRKWCVVPWDLDRTLGDHWGGDFDEARLPILLGTRQLPGVTGWNRLADGFLGEASLRARLFVRLRELLDKEFTTEKLFPILDRLETEISAAAALDRQRWPSSTPDLHTGIAQVKSYIKRRRAFLQAELAKPALN